MKLKFSIRRVRNKRARISFVGYSWLECPSCDAKVYPEDRFCHHCGQPFSQEPLNELQEAILKNTRYQSGRMCGYQRIIHK